jgi:hypothetical protein
MTWPDRIAFAALDLAHALRWPALALAAWFVGYAVFGPVGTW